MAATVVDEQTAIPRAGAACKRAAEAVLKTRKVVVALVTDETIAELHERFLEKPGPTDVLSFPHGEIVVSGDTALREAQRRDIDPVHELMLYVVHGALHLAGHDDRTERQEKEMRAAERRVLHQLGLGDVFGAGRAPDGRRPRKPGKKARQKAAKARRKRRR